MSTIGHLRMAAVAAIVALGMLPASVVMAEGHGDTKGNSGSNPDGNGGDHPYAAAGAGAASQGPAYYDGNNGCGQDRRFDIAPDFQGGFDDNNGRCAPRPDLEVGAPTNVAARSKAGVAQPAAVAGESPVSVAAVGVQTAVLPAAVEPAVQVPTAVLSAGAPSEVAAAPAPQAAPQAGGPPGDEGGLPVDEGMLAALVALVGGSGLVLRFARERLAGG